MQQKIEELNQKLFTLNEQKTKIAMAARNLAEKRNKLNEHYAKSRTEISGLRDERDRLNNQVKDLKLQRNEMNAKIHEKIDEIKNLSKEIKIFVTQKPSRSLQSLQKEIDDNEWKIQTTSLSLLEEKELVQRIKQLEAHAGIHRKLSRLHQRKLELQNELQTLKTKIETCHNEIMATAQKSQQIHQLMMKKIEESKKPKMEADEIHTLFLQAKEKAVPIKEEINVILDQIRQLKMEIQKTEETERKKTEEKLRSNLEKQAKEKLKRGEKLTWEEFQLLASDIETNDKA